MLLVFEQLKFMSSNLFLLATICFIAMISPGPDFLLVTKNSIVHSQRLALATAFGIVTGCLFHATYCILGLALIIVQSAVIFSMIKYAGAGYLIYLGLKGILAKKSANISEIAHTENSANNITAFKAYTDGLFCNVLNPKLAVFLLSLFTQFVAVNASVSDKALVAGVFVSEAALYWPLLVLLLQSQSVRWLFHDCRKIVDRFCGVLLIYLGIRVGSTNILT